MRLIFPFIFIVLSVVGGFIYVKPLFSEVSSLRTDMASYEKALSNSKNLQKTRDNLITSYKSISPSDKERLNKFLPNSVNNIQLILEIQQVANKHNLSIKNISFKPPVAEPNPKEDTKDTKTTTNKNAKKKEVSPFGVFDLEFKTKSDYKTFTSFIKDLEQNLRLIDIVGISFTVPSTLQGKQPADFDPNIFDFTVKIKTYWLR